MVKFLKYLFRPTTLHRMIECGHQIQENQSKAINRSAYDIDRPSGFSRMNDHDGGSGNRQQCSDPMRNGV